MIRFRRSFRSCPGSALRFTSDPRQKRIQQIVRTLAERNGIDMSEDQLLLEANKWELSHGGLSGRTAQQFVDYVLGTTAQKQKSKDRLEQIYLRKAVFAFWNEQAPINHRLELRSGG